MGLAITADRITHHSSTATRLVTHPIRDFYPHWRCEWDENGRCAIRGCRAIADGGIEPVGSSSWCRAVAPAVAELDRSGARGFFNIAAGPAAPAGEPPALRAPLSHLHRRAQIESERSWRMCRRATRHQFLPGPPQTELRGLTQSCRTRRLGEAFVVEPCGRAVMTVGQIAGRFE